MLGYEDHEIENAFSGWKKLWHPDDVTRIEEALKDYLDEKTTKYEIEHRLRHKDGDWRWILTRGDIIKDHDGKPYRWVGTNLDITERKKAEEELKSINKRYSVLFNQSPIAIEFYDALGGLIIVNEATLELFGVVDKSEVIGFKLFEDPNITGEKKAELLKNRSVRFESEFNFEEVKRLKLYQTTCSGIKILDWSTTPLIVDDLLIGYVVQVQDITEFKQTEQALIIAKEKAEKSDRLKSAFLANMSHEIRTPMNGIIGFAELLKEPGLSGETQQEYIRIIEKGGARMLNIINDIVSISKIEAGMMGVNIQESNINEQIEYIYTFFKPEVEGKGMQLSFSNSLPSREVTLKTDREKVYAILANLVKNAIKYSEKGSIEFGYVKKAGFLEFYVKDTGIGIPKDRQEAIFERFLQADIADKMARQGAGLGLSISKAYVEMLGGNIWVESEEGKGSVFYFTLPYPLETIKENSTKKEISTPVEALPINKLKILIVEDDEPSEMFLSALVKEHSTTVLKAGTGIEAVDICRNNPDIDLVLMDIQMPGLNGYEATRQIRQFNKDVIIIAQTAFGLSGDKEKAIEAGCNDYISKPINKDKLLALIQQYFKK
jgi:PAS domain S-box-containing protein